MVTESPLLRNLSLHTHTHGEYEYISKPGFKSSSENVQVVVLVPLGVQRSLHDLCAMTLAAAFHDNLSKRVW